MTAMNVVGEMAGRDVQFNQKGFLAHFEDWDNDLAYAMAQKEGLALTECHWTVIEFLREYYAFHEIPPSPKVIIRRSAKRSPSTPPAPARSSKACSQMAAASRPAASRVFPTITAIPASHV